MSEDPRLGTQQGQNSLCLYFISPVFDSLAPFVLSSLVVDGLLCIVRNVASKSYHLAETFCLPESMDLFQGTFPAGLF